MKKFSLLFIMLFYLFNISSAQSPDETIIRSEIEKQRLAWNKGDIESFMGTYWQNDSLMFIGKSGVTYGWQNTLNNYKRGYPDTAAMGKLDFDILQVKPLSDTYFFVVGKWHLTRSIGNAGGHFTLLFRKIKNKWVIVADHSS
ncbi:MAG: nuclear transport factor 2 family protein [Ferruginibacter sp.]|nr:nuclear transport factor 2 family protein [Ferruginibacter sp.]MBU9935649.1 nuclear transport factor 2 family protein [Ferruginibacter sp.]HQY11169.1 nuclear transport factor 2 family protein [Ferruginibacter sp.]